MRLEFRFPAVRPPIAAIAATLVTLVVFGLAARSRVSGFQCHNLPLAEAVAPDGSRRAVTFVRDCGRRAPRSTQLSILGANEPLGEHGNVFVAELERSAQIEMRWAVDGALEVRTGKIRRAYRADPGVGRTRIRYGRLP
jgi:hypothetical protein